MALSRSLDSMLRAFSYVAYHTAVPVELPYRLPDKSPGP